MLNPSGGDTWGTDIGTFLFANGNMKLRSLTFSLSSAVIGIGIIAGASLQQLETFAREFPKEFVDFTQALRHDVWTGLKHLSVSFEDVWLRITRPRELINTSFAKFASSGEVALLFIINLHDRCDVPAVASSLQGISRSPDLLKAASAAFARVFTRHTTHRIFLRSAAVACGSEISRTDDIFFNTLEYIATFTAGDGLCAERGDEVFSFSTSGNGGGGADGDERIIRVTMEEIHDFLYPPPPRVPVERYVATRTMTPDVAPRQPSAVSAAPVASTSLVSASQPRQLTYADRPLVGSLTAPSQHVRRREAPWTATSYHNPATAEFAPQRTFCSPASGRGMQTSVKPSIAVTASPASPMNSSRQSHDESFGSVVHHVGSRGASTPVRRWAQRGAAVPEPSPSIRF